jgi:hypothetical protein
MSRLEGSVIPDLRIRPADRDISNAEIKKRNFGADSIGGNLDFSFSFSFIL